MILLGHLILRQNRTAVVLVVEDDHRDALIESPSDLRDLIVRRHHTLSVRGPFARDEFLDQIFS